MNKIKNIGDLLLEYKMINKGDLDKALDYQKKAGVKIGQALVQLGLTKQEQIDYILSIQTNEPFIILDNIEIDEGLVKNFDKKFLLENRILPIYEDYDSITIVTDDPFNHAAFSKISSKKNKIVNISVSYGKSIDENLEKFAKNTANDKLLKIAEDLNTNLMGTSFYRIDFLSSQSTFNVKIYGFNIVTDYISISAGCNITELREALDRSGMEYFYHFYQNNTDFIMSIYPLLRGNAGLPGTLSRYGLSDCAGIAFSDLDFRGSKTIFKSETPVKGYCFYSFKQFSEYNNAYNVIDNLHKDVQKANISGYLPESCSECGSEGCNSCGNTGYKFKEIEKNTPIDSILKELNGVSNG